MFGYKNSIFILCIIILGFNSVGWSEVEKSFDLWDWTKPCQEISLFEEWVSKVSHFLGG